MCKKLTSLFSSNRYMSIFSEIVRKLGKIKHKNMATTTTKNMPTFSINLLCFDLV